MKKKILEYVSDLVGDFVYYDRKECEDLSADNLKKAIASGKITVDEIVDKFREGMQDTFPVEKKEVTPKYDIRIRLDLINLENLRSVKGAFKDDVTIVALGHLFHDCTVEFRKYEINGLKLMIPVSAIIRAPFECTEFFNMIINDRPFDHISINTLQECIIKTDFNLTECRTDSNTQEVYLKFVEVDGFFKETDR